MALIEDIIGWLALQAGKLVYEESLNMLYRNLGLVSDGQTDLRPLDKYLRELHEELSRIRDRIDEDRLAKLYSGFSQLRGATKRSGKNAYLAHALDRFYEIAAIPELGRTGQFSNKELQCLAFLGMASAHSLLGDSDKLVMEKLVSAVLASGVTAKEFIGTYAVSISQRLGITSP